MLHPSVDKATAFLTNICFTEKEFKQAYRKRLANGLDKDPSHTYIGHGKGSVAGSSEGASEPGSSGVFQDDDPRTAAAAYLQDIEQLGSQRRLKGKGREDSDYGFPSRAGHPSNSTIQRGSQDSLSSKGSAVGGAHADLQRGFGTKRWKAGSYKDKPLAACYTTPDRSLPIPLFVGALGPSAYYTRRRQRTLSTANRRPHLRNDVNFTVGVHRSAHFRMVFSTQQAGLLGMSSLIKYDPRRDAKVTVVKSTAFADKYSKAARDGTSVYTDGQKKMMKKQGLSYLEHLLGSGKEVLTEEEAHELMTRTPAVSAMEVASFREYDPLYLDDPDIRAGHDRTIMMLEGFVGSIIPYIKPKDLKDELNEQFLGKHPWIDPNLTLSKIRNLKKRMLDVALECELDLTSVALAYAYFEKLVLAQIVKEKNRKIIGGTCLVLASKFNEPTRSKDDQIALLEELEDTFDVKASYFTEVEMSVYCDLKFALNLPIEEIEPHLQRIIQIIDNVDEYEPFVKDAQVLASILQQLHVHLPDDE